MKERFYRLKAKKEYLEERKAELTERLANTEERAIAVAQANDYVNQIALQLQNNIRVLVRNNIQAMLDIVFPGYTFVFEILENGNIRMALERDSTAFDIVDSFGGGVSDVISLGLRLSLLLLTRNERLLVLDEPMKFLSRDLQAEISEFLVSAIKKYELTILMVSHNEVHQNSADILYRVENKSGGSRVCKC